MCPAQFMVFEMLLAILIAVIGGAYILLIAMLGVYQTIEYSDHQLARSVFTFSTVAFMVLFGVAIIVS